MATRTAVVLLLAVTAHGCKTSPPVHPAPNETVVGASEIAAHLAEADRLYEAPRTVEAVRQSLVLCEQSFSENDEAGARWRAARACAWLATHDDEASRQRHAERGIEIGEESLSADPSNAEPFYYQALNIGLLSEITGSGLFRIKTMKQHALRVIEVDEQFHYAGGHRFLGILCYRTSRIPLFAAGTAEDARRHLARALELFPAHGENQLAMAEFHIWEDKPELARPYLEQLDASTPPPDLAAEHADWKRNGRELARQVVGR